MKRRVRLCHVKLGASLKIGLLLLFVHGTALAAVPDGYEDDDSYTNANWIEVISEVQIHNFHDQGDEDWVMFIGVEGRRYTVETTNPTGDFCVAPIVNTLVELYPYNPDPDNNYLAQDDDDECFQGHSKIFGAEYTPYSDTNIYYVRIRPANDGIHGDGTDYGVRVSHTSGVLGTVKGMVIDPESGCNNSTITVQDCGHGEVFGNTGGDCYYAVTDVTACDNVAVQACKSERCATAYVDVLPHPLETPVVDIHIPPPEPTWGVAEAEAASLAGQNHSSSNQVSSTVFLLIPLLFLAFLRIERRRGKKVDK